jgi:glycosyltransferase involved in cell wall biosynthesis
MGMKIDYFTSESPWPANSGGRLRAGAIHDALRRLGADVRLLVVGEELDAATTQRIEAAGGHVLPRRAQDYVGKLRRYLRGALRGHDPIAASLLDEERISRLSRLVAERRPNAIVLGNVYFAPLLPALERTAPMSRLILDNHNVESVLHRRLARSPGRLGVRLPAAVVSRTSQRLEREYLPRAAQVWACSETDAAQFRSAYRLPAVHVIPNAVDTESFVPSDEAPSNVIVYTGSFWYAPNESAARSLIALSQRIRARGVEHRLLLVGRAPTAAMLRQARANPNVLITGAVDDVRPYLERASIFAAPLRAGSGTKLKLLQAMAAGKAIITTPIGAEGLRLTPGVQALVVDHRDDFERGVVTLLRSPSQRASLGVAARAHVLRHFSLTVIERELAGALRAVLPGAEAAA